MREEASGRLPVTLGIALCAIAVTLGACSHKGHTTGRTRVAASAAPIPTAVAKETSVSPTLTIAGIVAPLQNVAVTTSLSEPTLAVYVSEGDHVRAGQVLAKLDTTDLQANRAAAVANLASDNARVSQTKYSAQLAYGQNPDQTAQAQAALKSAQETLALARVDLGRYKQLVAAGYVSNQQYTQQLTTVATDEASVRSQEAALSSAVTSQRINGSANGGLQAANVAGSVADAASGRAAIAQIDAQIARSNIVSPVDGIVVNRNINPGEYPGSRTSFTVQQISSVYAELNASSADVFRIKTGSPVKIVAGADTSGHVYQGKVVAVLGQVAPGSTNFTVKALVANPDTLLQSGIPVTGTISLGATRGIGIPTAAFLDDTNSSVLAVDEGTAKTTSVQQVATNGTTSIVTGLQEGTAVIANGQLGVTPGQKVNPSPGPSGGAPNAAPSDGASGSPGDASPMPSGHHHRHAQPAASDSP